MSLRSLDLTSALRPSLLPDETLLFVQDAVGLYGGKSKLADYQNGQAYLTSHRVCYVDNGEPRERAVAVDLKDVERCELYARFLKSSPKITLIPKTARLGSLSARIPGSPQVSSRSSHTSSPLRPSFTPPPAPRSINVTWVCPICSFSNAVPSNFDPAVANASTPLSPCQACGIKPPLIHVVKAAVASLSKTQREPDRSGGDHRNAPATVHPGTTDSHAATLQCPRCTFHNHPSLLSCEICGASLVSGSPPISSSSFSESRFSSDSASDRSPALPDTDSTEGVKFSFRAGGEKIFHDRLKEALVQRKWLLQSAPPVPKRDYHTDISSQARKDHANIGIAGLERRGFDMRKNNEMMIGNAFEDLAALMASAKDIVALAEEFSRSSQSRSNGVVDKDPSRDGSTTSGDPSALLAQLSLATTKDMLSGNGVSGRSLYLTELSRSLAEFLTDDTRGVLKSAGGVISLVDLWALFNRARGGVELVSPADFAAAAESFDSLNLPVRLRQFRSGLLVVQERSRTDEKTVKALLTWLGGFKDDYDIDVAWDVSLYGRGITVQETADRFGWSIGVAAEELDMAEGMGALCRESGLEGTNFWENYLIRDVPVGF